MGTSEVVFIYHSLLHVSTFHAAILREEAIRGIKIKM